MDREATCDAAKCFASFQASHDIDGHKTDAGSVTNARLPRPILLASEGCCTKEMPLNRF